MSSGYRDELCVAVYGKNCTKHHALDPMCLDAARLIVRLRAERDEAEAHLSKLIERMKNVDRGVVITTEQIDMLWKRRSFYTGAALAAIDDCLDAINIVACPECGGSGMWPPPQPAQDEPCPGCQGHGWIMKEHGDATV